MYRAGHYGVSIGLYSPIAAALVGRGEMLLAIAGAAIVVWLAMLPDLDTRIPGISHRGPTHSLAFAVAVGGVVGFLADAVVAPVFGDLGATGWAVPGLVSGVGAFSAAVATLTIVSHLLADVITPMGIRPFWPISDWSITLDITPAKNPTANYLLLAAGTFVAATAVLSAL